MIQSLINTNNDLTKNPKEMNQPKESDELHLELHTHTLTHTHTHNICNKQRAYNAANFLPILFTY